MQELQGENGQDHEQEFEQVQDEEREEEEEGEEEQEEEDSGDDEKSQGSDNQDEKSKKSKEDGDGSDDQDKKKKKSKKDKGKGDDSDGSDDQDKKKKKSKKGKGKKDKKDKKDKKKKDKKDKKGKKDSKKKDQKKKEKPKIKRPLKWLIFAMILSMGLPLLNVAFFDIQDYNFDATKTNDPNITFQRQDLHYFYVIGAYYILISIGMISSARLCVDSWKELATMFLVFDSTATLQYTAGATYVAFHVQYFAKNPMADDGSVLVWQDVFIMICYAFVYFCFVGNFRTIVNRVKLNPLQYTLVKLCMTLSAITFLIENYLITNNLDQLSIAINQQIQDVAFLQTTDAWQNMSDPVQKQFLTNVSHLTEFGKKTRDLMVIYVTTTSAFIFEIIRKVGDKEKDDKKKKKKEQDSPLEMILKPLKEIGMKLLGFCLPCLIKKVKDVVGIEGEKKESKKQPAKQPKQPKQQKQSKKSPAFEDSANDLDIRSISHNRSSKIHVETFD